METNGIVMSRSEELSVVNFLMSYVQNQDNMELIYGSIQHLVRLLEDRSHELNSLLTVICTGGTLSNKCITLTRPVHKIWRIAGHFVSYPHLLYIRIWRWPNLAKEELQHIQPCQFGFDLGHQEVCINPYHYEKKQWMRNEPGWINRQYVMSGFQDQNFVNLTHQPKVSVWPGTQTLNHVTLFTLPNNILAGVNRENMNRAGCSPEGNWRLPWSPEMPPLGEYHESCRLDERYSTYLVDAIRYALRFVEQVNLGYPEELGKSSSFDDDTVSIDSSTSEQSFHSALQDLESPVPSTSSGLGRFTDDSTGSEESGGIKKKIWRHQSAKSSQEKPKTDPKKRANSENFKKDEVMTNSVSETRRSPTDGENEEFCIFEDMDSPTLGPLATVAVDCAMAPILEDEKEVELYNRLQRRRNV